MSCKNCKKTKFTDMIANIVEGNMNLAFPSPDVEAIATERRKVCDTCEFRNPLVKWKGVQYYYCGKCKCPIESKVRAPKEECPMSKW